MNESQEQRTDSVEPLLKLVNVEKRFGNLLAVENLNLDIGSGDFVAIMGPSGCGKTTTLQMLAGLEQPTSGSIIRNGQSINDVPPWLRQMPLVWQSYALFPFLTVMDNVGFGLRNIDISKKERHRRSMSWLERLGIEDLKLRSPGTLSGGQAQRVALARALVLEPEVLLLDEPLSALDANMVVRMQSELAELQRDLGITFVYVTHNQSEAFAMANQMVIMDKGKIQQTGSPIDVYRTPKTRFVAEFVGTNNIIGGKIGSIDETGCSVETTLGKFISSNSSGALITVGQEIDLVVSADLMIVNKDTQDKRDNVISAHLVGESFVGNIVTLVLEGYGGLELKVQIQQRAFQDLNINVNDKVALSFQPEDALIIPKIM